MAVSKRGRQATPRSPLPHLLVHSISLLHSISPLTLGDPAEPSPSNRPPSHPLSPPPTGRLQDSIQPYAEHLIGGAVSAMERARSVACTSVHGLSATPRRCHPFGAAFCPFLPFLGQGSERTPQHIPSLS